METALATIDSSDIKSHPARDHRDELRNALRESRGLLRKWMEQQKAGDSSGLGETATQLRARIGREEEVQRAITLELQPRGAGASSR